MSRAELESFALSFSKAIRQEMDAMRRRLGSFELPVGEGRRAEAGSAPEAAGTSRARLRYRFKALERNDKLLPGIDCTFRAGGAEYLVRVTDVDGTTLTLESERSLPLTGPSVLVIYPWFLYERLMQAVEGVPGSETHFPGTALAAFGKVPPILCPDAAPLRPHGELNASQQEAVSLCLRSSVAFVWGPPGTGKTMTLGHIVEELYARGSRVLVTSTTHAAVDQALAKLASLPPLAAALDAGEIVRVGRSDSPTLGAELHEVARKKTATRLARLRSLEDSSTQASGAAALALTLAEKLESGSSEQLDLFDTLPGTLLGESDLDPLLSGTEAGELLALPEPEQAERLRVFAAGKAAAAAGSRAEIEALRTEIGSSEGAVLRGARVILATMAGVYVNPLLAAERFDAVVVEEAGMAVLPAVFACSALARSNVIFVGDPRQLPPIVQSDEPYVRRAMGRSIFAVTAPDPARSELVALLDLQYRMHPEIGSLVSRLYYDGLVRNGIGAEERRSIAAAPPEPGRPVVLIDVGGEGACATPQGSYSRYNPRSAERCIGIAQELTEAGIGSVAIITPYAEQARLIRRLLAERRLHGVECRTVHGFQGNERDAVILDTVDGEPFPPGVLLAGTGEGSAAANLLNVSVSRARGKLVLLADVEYYRARAPESAIGRLLAEVARQREARSG